MKAQRVKDKIWVQWQGRLYAMAANPALASRSRSEEAQELVAPFSCKVLKLHVSAGQKVKKGDPIVVVEAMKMEYSYASPRDGIIGKVQAKEGEIVPAGVQFVQWEGK
ncbi:MAG: acetyl-CoA carboxylase biotin carboxyl carrier protein subunit [Bdellovibrionota bacterium]